MGYFQVPGRLPHLWQKEEFLRPRGYHNRRRRDSTLLRLDNPKLVLEPLYPLSGLKNVPVKKVTCQIHADM